MGRKIRLWLTGFFLLATLASLSFYFSAGQKTYSDQTIRMLSNKLQNNIVQFLEQNKTSSEKFEKFLSRRDYRSLTSGFLNQYAVRLLQNNPQMHGVIVFGPHFHFLFARDKQSWVATYDTVFSDSLTNWIRLTKNMKKAGEWTDTYHYFIDEKSLENNYNNLKNYGTRPLWKVLLNKGAHHKNFVLSSYKVQLKDGKPLTFAFVYDLKRQRNTFFPVVKVKNPVISLITDRDKFTFPLNLPDSSGIVVEKNPVVRQVSRLLDEWEKSPEKVDRSFLFEQKGKRYWMHIAPIPASLGLKAVSIATTEQELNRLQHFEVNIYGYAAIVFGVLALLGILSFRKKSKPTAMTEPVNKVEISALIRAGENENVEFKSSLRWDYREQKVNPVLETVILKSIAAFANGKGGTLIIGVNDEVEILGLKPDFNTLKKKDVDGFELHLRRLIKNQFGISFTTAHLQVMFPEVEGKTLCVIRISPSHHPLYLKTKNKNGNETEKFYVRMGNASQEIASLHEIHQYIRNRFE
jgi:hypothetical protein